MQRRLPSGQEALNVFVMPLREFLVGLFIILRMSLVLKTFVRHDTFIEIQQKICDGNSQFLFRMIVKKVRLYCKTFVAKFVYSYNIYIIRYLYFWIREYVSNRKCIDKYQFHFFIYQKWDNLPFAFHKCHMRFNCKLDLKQKFTLRKKIWLNQCKLFVWKTFFDLKKWFI